MRLSTVGLLALVMALIDSYSLPRLAERAAHTGYTLAYPSASHAVTHSRG
jgi:hypothetical protein